jgi:hypothetical protein
MPSGLDYGGHATSALRDSAPAQLRLHFLPLRDHDGELPSLTQPFRNPLCSGETLPRPTQISGGKGHFPSDPVDKGR